MNNYRRSVSTLLRDLGNDPARYDAATLRDALLHRVKTGSRAQAQNLASSLRMYLRHLASADLCPPGLVCAVPTIPDRSHTRLPRYVSSEDIERSIARRALERAGVKSARPLAAHAFRHSAATTLLRSGAPLEVIGTLLRHSTPKSTAIYAKVDVRMLREVVQPWPIPGGSKWR